MVYDNSFKQQIFYLYKLRFSVFSLKIEDNFINSINKIVSLGNNKHTLKKHYTLHSIYKVSIAIFFSAYLNNKIVYVNYVSL